MATRRFNGGSLAIVIAIISSSLLFAIASGEGCGSNNIPYSTATQMCCAGMVFARNTSFIICCQDRIFGLGDPSAKKYWDCCSDQAYDTRYQVCEGGRPSVKQSAPPAAKVEDSKISLDYFENPSDVPPPPPPKITTTTTTERTTTTQRRTRPTTSTTMQPSINDDSSRSCSDRSYNPDTQVCCGGYVYVRSTPTVLCCAGALFAIGETDGDLYWACCDHTIFDRRRQTCSPDGIVLQLPKVTETPPPIAVAVTVTQPTASTKTGPSRPYTLPAENTRTPAPAQPPAAPAIPVGAATFPSGAPPGFKTVACASGEMLTVKDTGSPMMCCGRSIYDSSQQVCLGDQYTLHKSLVPGLPTFFVSLLNTTSSSSVDSSRSSGNKMPSVEEPKTRPPTTSTTTSTTTTTTTTTTTAAPPATQDAIFSQNSNKMEISCNGNVYQVPLTRLDKVACCGQYLYDARYYQCSNGVVIATATSAPDASIPSTLKPPPSGPVASAPAPAPPVAPYLWSAPSQPKAPSSTQYATSMPFVHSFFPTPAPVAPRSFDRVQSNSKFGETKPTASTTTTEPIVSIINNADPSHTSKQIVVYSTQDDNDAAQPNDENSYVARMPKPQPSFPIVAPEGIQQMGSLPYVPFWNPQSMKQTEVRTAPSSTTTTTTAAPRMPPAAPDSNYGSQLSMWNRFPASPVSSVNDYEAGSQPVFNLPSANSDRSSFAALPEPVSKVPAAPVTTPRYQNFFAPSGNDNNWGAMPQAIRPSYPGYIAPTNSRLPPSMLPKPANTQYLQEPAPTKIVLPPNYNGPNVLGDYSNNRQPSGRSPVQPQSRQRQQQNFDDPPLARILPASSGSNDWPMPLRQASGYQQLPQSAFMMTPVTPVETKPVSNNNELFNAPRPVSNSNSNSNSQNQSSMMVNFLAPTNGRSPLLRPAPAPALVEAAPTRTRAGSSNMKPAGSDAKCQNGRLMQAPTSDQDFVYCCNNRAYDIRSQFCCGGVVEEWLGTENGRVYQLCCDGVYIYNVNGDPNVQCCGRTAINTKYEPCSSVSL